MAATNAIRREGREWATFRFNPHEDADPEPYRSLVLERQRIQAMEDRIYLAIRIAVIMVFPAEHYGLRFGSTQEMLSSFTDYFDHYRTFWDYFCTQPFTMVLIMLYMSHNYFSGRAGVLIS